MGARALLRSPCLSVRKCNLGGPRNNDGVKKRSNNSVNSNNTRCSNNSDEVEYAARSEVEQAPDTTWLDEDEEVVDEHELFEVVESCSCSSELEGCNINRNASEAHQVDLRSSLQGMSCWVPIPQSELQGQRNA